jgi:hypothetical protein
MGELGDDDGHCVVDKDPVVVEEDDCHSNQKRQLDEPEEGAVEPKRPRGTPFTTEQKESMLDDARALGRVLE